MKGVNILQPKKKPRGGELTPEEKEGNRLISSVRIVIEHVISGVKRCRIVKDIFRNTKADYDDMVIEIACALHNFRSYNRRQAYYKSITDRSSSAIIGDRFKICHVLIITHSTYV